MPGNILHLNPRDYFCRPYIQVFKQGLPGRKIPPTFML